MLELLIGKKGTGKTKVLIDSVNRAAGEAHGNVIFISNNTGRNMYDIDTKVRMADTSDFDIKSWEEFLGFVCGIISSNFDISNIYIDGVLKIVKDTTEGMEVFLNSDDEMSKKVNIDVMISVSMDASEAPEYIKKYVK